MTNGLSDRSVNLSSHNKAVARVLRPEGFEFLGGFHIRPLSSGTFAANPFPPPRPELTVASRGCLLRIDDRLDIVPRIFRDIPEKNQ